MYSFESPVHLNHLCEVVLTRTKTVLQVTGESCLGIIFRYAFLTGPDILQKLTDLDLHCFLVERCGAVVKRRTRDREVPGSIPTNCKCCFLEQETLSTLLSTGFYPGKKRATWKISTRLLNVLPSINKVDYYYYYYSKTKHVIFSKRSVMY